MNDKGNINELTAKEVIARLFKYMGRYKFLFILVVMFVLMSSFAMIIGSYFLKPIINDYIIPRKLDGMYKVLIYMGIIYTLGSLSSYGYSRIMIYISQHTLQNIRKDLFNKMQSLPIGYFDNNLKGDLMSLYTNDIDNIGEAINNSFANIFYCIITFIGTITVMIILNPILTGITFLALIVMFIVMNMIMGKGSKYFSMQQNKLGEINGFIEEMIQGQRETKIFCHEEKNNKDLSKINKELKDISTKAQTYSGSVMPIFSNISYINYTITCCVGGVMVITGMADLGTLLSFIQYVRQVADPISEGAEHVNVIMVAIAALKRIFKVLDEKDEVDEGKAVLTKEINEGIVKWNWNLNDNNITTKPLCGKIEFKDVVFRYEDDKNIFEKISLSAEKGEKIAIVGTTGAGKTTILNLISRFYEINSGEITYDSIDIRNIKKSDLRKAVSIVLQDTHLFTGTIKDNIKYGNLDASDEEIIKAAKLANADVFIKHLSQGYDTVISGNAEILSEGEKQLIAIARAAVADPPVLILDEATSNMDTRTEAIIQKSMDKLMKGRTVFVIAHRLSTVKNADKIIVLERGKIIETGNHEELLEAKGKYYELCTGTSRLD